MRLSRESQEKNAHGARSSAKSLGGRRHTQERSRFCPDFWSRRDVPRATCVSGQAMQTRRAAIGLFAIAAIGPSNRRKHTEMNVFKNALDTHGLARA
jgi:hypothetical protein